jgi:hypothetical protein
VTFYVLFTGSRSARVSQEGQRRTIFGALKEAEARSACADGRVTLVHGAEPKGADSIADDAAKRFLHWDVEPYPADWYAACRGSCKAGHREVRAGEHQTYCPAAGSYRNQWMVDIVAQYLPDAVCVATPGRFSTGTWDCVRRADAAGIPLITRELPAWVRQTAVTL